MSADALAWARRLRRRLESPGQALVLDELAFRHVSGEPGVRVSQRALCASLPKGCGRSSVRRWLSELQELGVIDIHTEKGRTQMIYLLIGPIDPDAIGKPGADAPAVKVLRGEPSGLTTGPLRAEPSGPTTGPVVGLPQAQSGPVTGPYLKKEEVRRAREGVPDYTEHDAKALHLKRWDEDDGRPSGYRCLVKREDLMTTFNLPRLPYRQDVEDAEKAGWVHDHRARCWTRERHAA